MTLPTVNFPLLDTIPKEWETGEKPDDTETAAEAPDDTPVDGVRHDAA